MEREPKSHGGAERLKKKKIPSPHTLVVGGTRGIGLELVKFLAKKGHRVSVIGRTRHSIPRVRQWLINICQPQFLETTLKDIVHQQGPLHHVVFLQRYRDGKDWDGEIETSLTATQNIMERLKKVFARKGNRSIVMVGSVNDHLISPHLPIGYHVAKAGLWQMVRYYAVELGKMGIRVNGISPGTVLKKESRSFFLQRKNLMHLMKTITPLGRMGTAEELAKVISFLLGPESSLVTGQNIIVDGGVSLQWQEGLARKITNI